jgi:hypothetical protein
MFARMLLIGLLTGCLGSQSLLVAGHTHRKTTPTVSPMDELEILDPLIDQEGKPRAIMVPDEYGVEQLEVPTTVIIHKHYYTGSRDFQGPMLQGGPVLVVVRHPATGEQTYVELQLPPGAPRIFYKEDRIIYQYRDDRVTLCFGRPGWLGQLGKPAVGIRPRLQFVKHVQEHEKAKQERHQAWLDRSGIPEALASCRKNTAGAVGHTADVVKAGGSVVMAPIRVLRDNTPVGGLLGIVR